MYPYSKSEERCSIPTASFVIFIESFLLAFLLSKNWIVSGIMIYACYSLFQLFFHSIIWRRLAGYGPLNIIPTLIIIASVPFLVIPLICLSIIPLLIGFIFEPVAYITASIFFQTLAYIYGAVFFADGKISSGRKVVVANHSSFIDTIALAYIMGKLKWSSLVSKKMFFIPPFCLFLPGRAIGINRRISSITQLKKINIGMRKKISEGYNFAIFPEATRFSDGELHEFKDGAFKLAFETNTPVVPVVLKYPWIYKPKNRFWICPMAIQILYGDEIVSSSENILKETTFMKMKEMLFSE